MPLNEQHAGGGGKPSPATLLRRWLVLLLALSFIAGFIVIVPKVERVPLLGPVVQILREKGTYVGGWYWDMVDEVEDAATFMRRALGRGAPDRKQPAHPTD